MLKVKSHERYTDTLFAVITAKSVTLCEGLWRF